MTIKWHKIDRTSAHWKSTILSTEKTFYEKYQIFFFYQSFLQGQWRFTGQQAEGEDHLLFHSTTSTRSQTLRHLFATLHVRWRSRVFNRNACIYQAATRWDLPPYRITIWVIEWWCISVCLRDELILAFCYMNLTLENGWYELASTITLVLQANLLTKCASHCEIPDRRNN